jgi:hypothetical protein
MDHSNLFLYAINRKQVYQKLIEDQRRDLKEAKKMYGAAAVFWLAAVFLFPEARLYLLLMGAGAMLNGLVIAMDRSNRNWFLHFLDYEDWKEHQAARFEGPRNRLDVL